jgi:hypothetical protein
MESTTSNILRWTQRKIATLFSILHALKFRLWYKMIGDKSRINAMKGKDPFNKLSSFVF